MMKKESKPDQYYTYHYDSPLGGITLASDGDAIVGLWFDGQKYYADSLNERYEEKNLPVFEETVCYIRIQYIFLFLFCTFPLG